MKILHVVSAFKPAWQTGGTVRAAYGISRNLVKQGHQVTVFTTDRGSRGLGVPTNQPVTVDDIEVYYFRNVSNSLARKKITTPYYLPIIAKKRVREFDIIHIHEHRTLLAGIIHHYAMRYDIPYVVEAWGSVLPLDARRVPKRLFDMLFGYRILKHAAKVIAGAEVEIDEYKKMGIDEDKISLVSPGYEIDSFSDLPALGQFRAKFGIKEKHIVLFLGRIHKVKGIDFLIESFNELAQDRNDVTLVIAGPDDGYKFALESLIEKLELSTRVSFTGFLDGEDKLSALVDATILVQTSIYERGPGSPFEAILCNTPIIVTRDTGCSEIVAELDAGYLVKYGSVSELKTMMQRILDDPTEARGKMQKAKQYIVENLSPQIIVKEYEKLYQSAIEQRRED